MSEDLKVYLAQYNYTDAEADFLKRVLLNNGASVVLGHEGRMPKNFLYISIRDGYIRLAWTFKCPQDTKFEYELVYMHPEKIRVGNFFQDCFLGPGTDPYSIHLPLQEIIRSRTKKGGGAYMPEAMIIDDHKSDLSEK